MKTQQCHLYKINAQALIPSLLPRTNWLIYNREKVFHIQLIKLYMYVFLSYIIYSYSDIYIYKYSTG